MKKEQPTTGAAGVNVFGEGHLFTAKVVNNCHFCNV